VRDQRLLEKAATDAARLRAASSKLQKELENRVVELSSIASALQEAQGDIVGARAQVAAIERRALAAFVSQPSAGTAEFDGGGDVSHYKQQLQEVRAQNTRVMQENARLTQLLANGNGYGESGHAGKNAEMSARLHSLEQAVSLLREEYNKELTQAKYLLAEEKQKQSHSARQHEEAVQELEDRARQVERRAKETQERAEIGLQAVRAELEGQLADVQAHSSKLVADSEAKAAAQLRRVREEAEQQVAAAWRNAELHASSATSSEVSRRTAMLETDAFRRR
jgi:hypothetical protein